IRGPFQGLAGMTGAIDSDNDARHVNLLFTQSLPLPCTSADDLRHTGLRATEPKFATISRRFADALVAREYPAPIPRNSGMARMPSARRGRAPAGAGRADQASRGRPRPASTTRPGLAVPTAA